MLTYADVCRYASRLKDTEERVAAAVAKQLSPQVRALLLSLSLSHTHTHTHTHIHTHTYRERERERGRERELSAQVLTRAALVVAKQG